MSKELIHIIERIKEIKHLQSKTAVAEAIGISKENLNGYLKRNKIPLEAVLLFCEKENISPTYLLYGTEKIPNREKIRLKYGMELPPEEAGEEIQIYTTTAEKYATIFTQVREILDSGDDFVIKAMTDRLKDYRLTIAANRERRGIQQRLARIEQILEQAVRNGNTPGGAPPAGMDAEPADSSMDGGLEKEEKAM